jgi:hypothetical protein
MTHINFKNFRQKPSTVFFPQMWRVVNGRLDEKRLQNLEEVQKRLSEQRRIIEERHAMLSSHIVVVVNASITNDPTLSKTQEVVNSSLN